MTTLSSTARGAEPVVLPPNGLAASFRRIGALVKRYVYLLRSSGVRLVELIYWPFLQMLTWGFLQKYLAAHHEPAGARRGRADRLGLAVGHPVPLQNRLLHHFHRGDVVAQSRQSAYQPAARLMSWSRHSAYGA